MLSMPCRIAAAILDRNGFHTRYSILAPAVPSSFGGPSTCTWVCVCVCGCQNLRLREQWLNKEMSAVGADPKHEKVLDEINQVTLEVAKIESRLLDMGKGSRKRSGSSEEQF